MSSPCVSDALKDRENIPQAGCVGLPVHVSENHGIFGPDTSPDQPLELTLIEVVGSCGMEIGKYLLRRVAPRCLPFSLEPMNQRQCLTSRGGIRSHASQYSHVDGTAPVGRYDLENIRGTGTCPALGQVKPVGA